MRKLILICIVCILSLSILFTVKVCSNKNEQTLIIDSTTVEYYYDSIDFVFDTTLVRQYEDFNAPFDTGNRNLSDPQKVFQVAESILIEAFGKDKILRQKPFHLNKKDSIWIMEGSLPKLITEEYILMGGVAYIEITSNGIVLKIGHSK